MALFTSLGGLDNPTDTLPANFMLDHFTSQTVGCHATLPLCATLLFITWVEHMHVPWGNYP